MDTFFYCRSILFYFQVVVKSVKSALLSILPHVQHIRELKLHYSSDPWCIQLTLNTDSRRTNTDKYSLNICTYKLYRYTNEDIVEKEEIDKVA